MRTRLSGKEGSDAHCAERKEENSGNNSIFSFVFQENRGAAKKQVTHTMNACGAAFNDDVRDSVQMTERC